MSKRDPTNTTTLRNAFARDLRKRFNTLSYKLEEYIKKLAVTPFPIMNASQSFPLDPEKKVQFERWLQRQTDMGILSAVSSTSVGNRSASAQYIDSAFKRGIGDSFTKTRAMVMKRKDGDATTVKDSIQQYKNRDGFINAAFLAPVSRKRVELLYSRAYTGLRGITDEMSKQMSDVFATGMSEGRNPLEIARNLRNRVDKVGKVRAETLARTEVIRAHAEGALDGYEQLGLHGVSAQAEWTTARDAKVCPLCRPQEGKIYSLQEARGLIPRHPNCRCAWAPYVPLPEESSEKKVQQKTTEQIVEESHATGRALDKAEEEYQRKRADLEVRRNRFHRKTIAGLPDNPTEEEEEAAYDIIYQQGKKFREEAVALKKELQKVKIGLMNNLHEEMKVPRRSRLDYIEKRRGTGRFNPEKMQKAIDFVNDITVGQDHLVKYNAIKNGERAYSIAKGVWVAEKDPLSVYLHEVGHVIEGRSYSKDNKRFQATRALLLGRTQGLEAVRYRQGEYIKRGFATDYMGKIYRNNNYKPPAVLKDEEEIRATELMSSWYESLYNPALFSIIMRKDPDFFRFGLHVARNEIDEAMAMVESMKR